MLRFLFLFCFFLSGLAPASGRLDAGGGIALATAQLAQLAQVAEAATIEHLTTAGSGTQGSRVIEASKTPIIIGENMKRAQQYAREVGGVPRLDN